MSNGSKAIGGRAMVRLLKALARANAFAEIDEVESDQPLVRVYCGTGDPDSFDVTHHAAWDVWQRAIGVGLVERWGVDLGDVGGARWSISELGRERLRAHVGEKGRANGNASVANNGADRVRSNAQRSRVGPREAVSESPLGWLYRRRDKAGETLISESQFEAGERLRLDYEIGQLMPRLTVNWTRAAAGGSSSGTGAHHGLELSERAVAARERVSRALGAVGPELASVLVDVCCHLKGLEQLERSAGWPQRSAKIVLQLALSSLARHYGLERRERDNGRMSKGPAEVRHWGADGYRPQTSVERGDGDGL